MAPTIGRIVHYVAYGTPGGEYPKACRAAVVTKVNVPITDVAVGLAVLNPTGMFFNQHVPMDTGSGSSDGLCDGLDHAGGTWHWPAHCAAGTPLVERDY